MSHAIHTSVFNIKADLKKRDYSGMNDKKAHGEVLDEIQNRFHVKALEALEHTLKMYEPISKFHGRTKSHYGLPFHSELQDLLENGNWRQLHQGLVLESLNSNPTLGCDFDLDFNNYANWGLYSLGTVTEMYIGKKVPCYPYLFLYNTPKEGPHAGLMRLALFKNVPCDDVELVFPDIEPLLSLTDKLKTAIVGLIGVSVMLLGHLAGHSSLDFNDPVSLLTPLNLVTLAALGLHLSHSRTSFEIKINKFKNKLIEFRETHLVAHDSEALKGIVQFAWDQECKEEMLATHFLQVSKLPKTAEELDLEIERYLDSIGEKCDFEVDDALAKAIETGRVKLDVDGYYTYVR